MNFLPASWGSHNLSTDSQNKLSMCDLLLQWGKCACILLISIITVSASNLTRPMTKHPPVQVEP